jgi:hypothetical protein
MIADFEAGIRQLSENNLSAISIALEDAGVMFLEEDSVGVIGVRLRKKPG